MNISYFIDEHKDIFVTVGVMFLCLAIATMLLIIGVNLFHINSTVVKKTVEPRSEWIKDASEDHYRIYYTSETVTSRDSNGKTHTSTRSVSHRVYDHTDFHRYHEADNIDYLLTMENKTTIFVSKELFDAVHIEDKFDSWELPGDVKDKSWSYFDMNNTSTEIGQWEYMSDRPLNWSEGVHDIVVWD